MKFSRLIITCVLSTVFALSPTASASRLVILHTNDTHSQIDPDKEGLGGILRRKVLIDSIRSAEPNVMVVDAGDAVQGSLFFTLFDGEVEQKLMNALGYDIQIVGNHEFDNGLGRLAANYSTAAPDILATNYDFSGTPLAGMTVPYVMKNVDGKRVAFIGININPAGLIDRDNYTGLLYFDALATANAMASYLKHDLKADMVVALTHVGYGDEPGIDDVEIAAGSRDIDLIIGGHSHTEVFPGNSESVATTVANLDGRPVTIAQTGNSGRQLGRVVLDLDTRTVTDHNAITVDSRLDSRIAPADLALIAPYRAKVDSISGILIGTSASEMSPRSNTELRNFMADWAQSTGTRLIGRKPDFALVNKGGIRNGIAKGDVTQGTIINMLPFNNRVVVVEIKGDSLMRLFDIIASQGGQCVSKEVKATYSRKSGKIIDLKINGKKIDPARTYTVATIDYLARGGDSMTPLVDAPVIAKSDNLLYRDLINDIADGPLKDVPLKGDPKPRMIEK